MNQHFAHLHLHTEFSLLDGAIRVKDLVKFAKQQEWKALGITDHGNIFGAIKFFQLAKKQGIKPILGCEMYFIPDVVKKDANEKYFHIVLIVLNDVGYKNLCQLMAFSYEHGFYFRPRIDYKRLEQYNEGLITSTACLGGHIPKLFHRGQVEEAEKKIQWFKDLFGPDRFFLELQPSGDDFMQSFEGQMEGGKRDSFPSRQKELNRILLEQGKKWGIDCIATCDAHYMRPEDREAHEILLSVGTKDELSNPDRYSFGDCHPFVRTTQEMLQAFPDNPEIVWNTGIIADRCEFSFEFGKLFFPQYPLPEKKTQESYFENLCKEGLQRIKDFNLIPKEKHNDYDARLKEEMDLINKMGFIGYFLVVSDFIQWAKQQSIPVGPGRGSAAGTLVAWALQITNVDPLRYGLLFERFLNPERISMPDFDIDFCVERREEVINYVKDKYGHDCVCQIITFGTMMAKGVIKDVARVLSFPYQDANMITDMIPNQLKITLDEAIEQEPKLAEMIDSNPKVKQLFEVSKKLEGLTRHASKHAAGLVISPTPLAKTLPLYIPAKTNDLVAQYAMTELESVGFLKMDFLGLKNLTVIDRTLKSIKKNHNINIDLNFLPLDDPKVFDLVGKGQTNAVFQFESEGLKDVLKKLKPSKFEDLIAVNALYRPGPLGAGMVDDFIERRHGRQKVTYMFSELEPILKETYGVVVYQEQVMKIASAIAGYSLGSADILRRAMGKKKVEVMDEQKELFIKGAGENNFDTKKSEELFDLMAYFAGYGFNKSHSTAYALIAYQTAYLKAHYPKEFMAASVTFETSNPDQLTHYLHEISDMGIKTLLPSLNYSGVEFMATEAGILFGLRGIKNLGEAALRNIFEERKKKPFKDMLNFCKRVDLRSINKRVIENLICAGAADEFPGNRAQKVAEIERIIARAQEYKEREKTGQMSLFAPAKPISGGGAEELYDYKPLSDWSTKEKLEKEKEVAGFYLSSHPLKSYPILKWLKTDSFDKTLEQIKNISSINEPFVTCVGLKKSFREITTRKGDKMAFMQLEDDGSSGELVIFPKLYSKVEEYLEEHDVFLVKGTLDITSQTKCKIKANELIPIELLFEQTKIIEAVKVILPVGIDEKLLLTLQSKLSQGTTPLRISFNENQQDLLVNCSKRVCCSLEVLQEIEQIGVSVQLVV
jgi:DNA polymerase III subunit alpha